MTAAGPYEVGPSDLGQSFVRLAIVTGVAAWSYLNAGQPAWRELADHGHLLLALGYLAAGGALLAWSLWLERAGGVRLRQRRLRRVVGLVADVAALSAYTAIAGGHALIVFPFFLTVIIGYGYRFGLPYLYSAIAAGLAGFTLAQFHNPAFAQAPVLVAAYYLGLLIVPVYSALLLRRHQQVLDRLREVNDARTRFIAHISHELRTPLHAIMSSASLLREELAEARLPGRAPQPKLAIITEAADHLLTLVNRVLDLAAAGAGSLRVDVSTVDLFRVLRAAIAICRPAADARGIALEWRVAAGCPRFVASSAPHLQEILINTLGNAIKFTYAGSVSLEAGAREDRLRLTVRDTGTGIAPQALATLFQPFASSGGPAGRGQGGTGLGLAITKQYVEALGGRIALHAAEGRGTVCEIDLPLTDARQTAAARAATPLVAALLAERPATSDEQAWLMAGGWRVAWLSPARDPVTDEALREAQALIVDEAVTSVTDAGALRERAPDGAPLALWRRNGSPGSALPPGFNVSLRAGSLDDLQLLAGLASCAAPLPAGEPANRPVRPLRLLVVDDNETNLRTAHMALAAAGHAVELASGGDTALARLEAATFDVVVLDMHMPGTSGIEVARQLRERDGERAPPILLLTADFTEEARSAALAAGAAAVLTKPILPDALRAAVAAHAAPAPAAGPAVDGAFAAAVFADLGDAAGARALIDGFAEDAATIVARLGRAAETVDVLRLRRELHRLKGCAAALGARALLEAAEARESLSDAALAAAAPTLADELTPLVATAAAELATIARPSASAA